MIVDSEELSRAHREPKGTTKEAAIPQEVSHSDSKFQRRRGCSSSTSTLQLCFERRRIVISSQFDQKEKRERETELTAGTTSS